MRKFRGLTIAYELTETRRWVYGYHCQIEGDHFIIEDGADYIWEEDAYRINGMVEVVPKTIGQQTGRKDGKGKDIYQGDIIDCMLGGATHRVIIVRQDCPCFLFPSGQLYIGDVVQALIIGDIHTTPELMGEK